MLTCRNTSGADPVPPEAGAALFESVVARLGSLARVRLILAWERSRNKTSISREAFVHVGEGLARSSYTRELLREGYGKILILLRVFHSEPPPTTVRINVDGNAPIDPAQYSGRVDHDPPPGLKNRKCSTAPTRPHGLCRTPSPDGQFRS